MPPGVVTVTSTVPEPAGEVAVICVADSALSELALVEPNLTSLAPVRFVPVIVTVVPPAAGPLVGSTFVTVGAGMYVNWSPEPVELVPPGVLTVTSTVPEPAGEVAVTCVADSALTPLALVEPNLTSLAPVRFVPVIVTVVPPAAGPLVGSTFVTVGAGMYVYSSAAEVALVPPGVLTVTCTVPEPAGEVAVIFVADSASSEVALVEPNSTSLAPVRFVPVIVTVVPPAAGPLVGSTLVTVGAGMYVNWSPEPVELVPPGVLTVTSTVPEPAGEVAVTCVADSAFTPLALVEPNLTSLAPVRFVPVIVTVVPPAAGPLVGSTFVTVGAGMYVNWSPEPVALVPPGVLTVTSTVPEPTGEVAVTLVADSASTPLAFGRAELDFARAREVRAGDRHGRPAGGWAAGRFDFRDRRGRDVGVFVGGGGGARASGGAHGHVDRAGAGRRGGGDLRRPIRL